MKIRRRVERAAAPSIELPPGFTGLMIAVPAYGSVVHAACVRSLTAAIVQLSMMGVYNDCLYLENESMISRGRDAIATVFLESTQFSHLLMIDSDVSFPREAVLRLLLDTRHHDVVFCAYPRKRQPIGFPVYWSEDMAANGLRVHPETGCVEVEAGPAGCFMVTRAAVQKMVDAHPELRYRVDQPADAVRYALFKPFQDGEKLWSEDIAFCKRWRALGGAIWLNPYFDLTHWSGSIPFKGRILDMFQTAPAAAAREEAV